MVRTKSPSKCSESNSARSPRGSIGNVATEEADVLTPVFSTGVGAFLGVDRPTVPMGDAVYPVLTTRPTVGGPHSDSTDVPDTTGGFDADLLAPERIGASFLYRRMDAIRFPAMDPALRMALNMGLEEKTRLRGRSRARTVS